ncbi:hypothetical protein [Catellatospora chokoriensis]|uniref:Uncharacterized protein n=1 Tax=Catellatospora chokoriensis TaxID=310353 RepID=A0A8J3NRV1_9ACTN|nr:hypothetical protein [Catellatospora chokoriensis]GIF89803.1 hypothetical protein Cch02nite_32470 [Catellatospora chokoriensis]
MILSTSALQAIAAATGEVWPEHIWRHDTDGNDWRAENAKRLHRAAIGFNDNVTLLTRILTRLGEATGAVHKSLLGRAGLNTAPMLDTALSDLLTSMERHRILEEMLLDAYRAWRAHRPDAADPDVRMLLIQERDPAYGVVKLLRRHAERETWAVVPDTVAAHQHEAPFPDRVIGTVQVYGEGWLPTAYLQPEHGSVTAEQMHHLPVHDDITVACRMLLRWWALWHMGRPCDPTSGDGFHTLTAPLARTR